MSMLQALCMLMLCVAVMAGSDRGDRGDSGDKDDKDDKDDHGDRGHHGHHGHHGDRGSSGAVINIYTSGSSDSRYYSKKCKADEPKAIKYPVIAFSVGRKAGFTSTAITRIPMDYEFYNKEGYFDMKTSIFTAPVSGVYIFYFGASGQPGKKIYLFLYAGKPEKAIASTYNYNTAMHGHASGSVIIEMKEGDHASMWINKDKTVYQQTIPSTHFRGHLIAEIGGHVHGDYDYHFHEEQGHSHEEQGHSHEQQDD